MNQNYTLCVAKSIYERIKLLAEQTQRAELDIAISISYCVREEGMSVDKAFAMVEEASKEIATQGW